MTAVAKFVLRMFTVVAVLLALSPAVRGASEPGSRDLDMAIKSGDFKQYAASLKACLNQKAAVGVTEASLDGLLRDPLFANALDQHRLITKIGPDPLAAFAKASPGNGVFLSQLFTSTPTMDLYLEATVPLSLATRDEDQHNLSISAMETWKRILDADPDAKQGLYQKLAIATALAPPGQGGPGGAKSPTDPVERYKHFKAAHKNKELFPSFNRLTVWEYTHVVSSMASNEDLTWVREAINTWRPDLRKNELVVNSTSEVWRRASPHPYTDLPSVLDGGGKCGPRSSWAVMVNQAFGIPAIGVGQPAHACVAYKAADPSQQPQPGSAWKVGYGRGWEFSKLAGMTGPDFLVAVEERSHVANFSRVEHLRWFASALDAKDKAAAVWAVAQKIRQSAPVTKTDLKASAHADEAEKEIAPTTTGTKSQAASPALITLTAGAIHIDAAAFTKLSGLLVLDSHTGGKQVNFQKSIKESWVDYTLDVPASGTYALQMRIATANVEQVLDVKVGAAAPVTVNLPYTTGLWAVTQPVDVKLEKGKQTLRITAPFQRGVALRWLELKAKG